MTDPRFRPQTLELAADRASSAPPRPSSSAAVRAYELQPGAFRSSRRNGGTRQPAQRHRTALTEQVVPLRRAHREALRELVRLVDGQLESSAWPPLRKAAVGGVVWHGGCAGPGSDQEMAALHDRHAACLAQLQAGRRRGASRDRGGAGAAAG
ncbi:MAG: hypothetical protein R3E42_03800 [Burkholderiaceae bacterium]